MTDLPKGIQVLAQANLQTFLLYRKPASCRRHWLIDKIHSSSAAKLHDHYEYHLDQV